MSFFSLNPGIFSLSGKNGAVHVIYSKRFVTEPISIPPGTSCKWVAGVSIEYEFAQKMIPTANHV